MPKIVVRLKRKNLPDDFCLNELFYDALGKPTRKIDLPSEYGILTATDYSAFIGFQFCYSSIYLTHNVPIAVFDLGMSQTQKEWCHRQSNLIVLRYVSPFGYQIDWKKWHKPFFTWRSPFEKTVWIDADAMLCGNLKPVLEMYGDGSFFTVDNGNDPSSTLNYDELYSLLAISSILKDTEPYLNSGVFILDKKRDRQLLQDWCYLAIESFTNMAVGSQVRLYDQGALKWAVQKNNLVHRIIQDERYNLCVKNRKHPYPATKEGIETFMKLTTELAKKAYIIHWLDVPKPWLKWGEIANLDYSVSFKEEK